MSAPTPSAAPASTPRRNPVPRPEVTVVQQLGMVHWNQAQPFDGLLGIQRIQPDRLPVTLATRCPDTGKVLWGERQTADGRMELGVRRVVNGHLCTCTADVWAAHGLRAPKGRHNPAPLPGGPLDRTPEDCLAAGEDHPEVLIDSATKLARAAAADFAAALELARLALHNRSPKGRAAKAAWDAANAEKLEQWRAENAEQIAANQRVWARARRKAPLRQCQVGDGRRTMPTSLVGLRALVAELEGDTTLDPKQRANRLFYARRRIKDIESGVRTEAGKPCERGQL